MIVEGLKLLPKLERGRPVEFYFFPVEGGSLVDVERH